jgi:hypothetical protein
MHGEFGAILREYENHLEKTWQTPSKDAFPLHIFYAGKSRTIEELAELFESQNPDRVETGAVFTPSPIALIMAKNVLYTRLLTLIQKMSLDPPKSKNGAILDQSSIYSPEYLYQLKIRLQNHPKILERLPIEYLADFFLLEPCVGGGAFVIAILDVILEIYNTFNSDSNLLFDILRHWISKNLWICDLNPTALFISQLRIHSWFLSHFSAQICSFHLERKNIFIRTVQGNFLHPNGGLPDSQKFHLILGNPPYLSSDSMSSLIESTEIQEYKRIYRSILKSGSKPDYYFYFIAQSLQLLAPDGLLSFIVPNRILSNDYALLLRKELFTHGEFLNVVNFGSSIKVFGDVNVHPCIFIWKSLSTRKSSCYAAWDIANKNQMEKWLKGEISPLFIQQSIAARFGVIFSALDELTHNFLRKIAELPAIHDLVTIHEATRVARFEHRLTKNWPVRVTLDEYLQFPAEKKQYYVREVRGKEIQHGKLLKGRFYLQLPKDDFSTESKSSLTRDLTSTKIFLRELGDRLYCAVNLANSVPAIGYGGVYYMATRDLQSAPKNPDLVMLKLFLFFTADVATSIYRKLYHAGAWGTALKFRSAYLHRLPFWSINDELAIFCGILLISLQLADNTSSHENNHEFTLFTFFQEIIGAMMLEQIDDESPHELQTLFRNCVENSGFVFTHNVIIEGAIPLEEKVSVFRTKYTELPETLYQYVKKNAEFQNRKKFLLQSPFACFFKI